MPRKQSGPALILLKGHPGVGKTTLGGALARNLKHGGLSAALVVKDDVREAMDDHHGAAPLRPVSCLGGGRSAWRRWANDVANAAAGRAACTAIACRGTDVVILDSTLSDEAAFARLCGAAARAGVGGVAVVEVMADAKDEEWAARLRGRPEHKPGSVSALRELIKSYGGRDGWAAERSTFAADDDARWADVAWALPLPWAQAGADRTDSGLYVRVYTTAGLGPDELARIVVERAGPALF